jgi:enterochelin esterase-like enzyme
VIDDVLPWTQAHLPTIASRAGRQPADGTAGGFGAVDIAFRHPEVFSTVEAWAGYFHPLRDGPFAHATRDRLLANDPAFAVPRLAAALRRADVRIFLAAGRQDPVDVARARDFAMKLTKLHIDNILVLRPGGHHGSFWRRILPSALAYTFPRS